MRSRYFLLAMAMCLIFINHGCVSRSTVRLEGSISSEENVHIEYEKSPEQKRFEKAAQTTEKLARFAAESSVYVAKELISLPFSFVGGILREMGFPIPRESASSLKESSRKIEETEKPIVVEDHRKNNPKGRNLNSRVRGRR